MGSVRGVSILGFNPESRALAAGMQKGDVIVEYDGVNDLTTERLAELTAKPTPSETMVPVILMRGGQEHSLSVASGSLGISAMDTTVTRSLEEPATGSSIKAAAVQTWQREAVILLIIAGSLVADHFLARYAAFVLSDGLEVALWGLIAVSAVLVLRFYLIAFGLRPPWTKGHFRMATGHPFLYGCALGAGLVVSFWLTTDARLALGMAMFKLNNQPVQIEGIFGASHPLGDPGWSRWVDVPQKGIFGTRVPIERRSLLQTPFPLEPGHKLVLVGRESWAGIVIDEIRRAPDQSLQPTAAGEAPQVRGPRRMQ